MVLSMTKKKQRALASGAMPSSSPPVQLPSQLPQLQAATDAHLCSRERQFSALAADVYVLPAALERTLWLHNVVLLLVQHTLLLDEVCVTLYSIRVYVVVLEADSDV